MKNVMLEMTEKLTSYNCVELVSAWAAKQKIFYEQVTTQV
jgi:hypothetical protein